MQIFYYYEEELIKIGNNSQHIYDRDFDSKEDRIEGFKKAALTEYGLLDNQTFNTRYIEKLSKGENVLKTYFFSNFNVKSFIRNFYRFYQYILCDPTLHFNFNLFKVEKGT